MGISVCLHRGFDIRMFDNDIAKTFGLSEAVFIMHLQQEISKTIQMQKSGTTSVELLVKDGLVWKPWTVQQLAVELPFWSPKQIRRVKESCIAQGAVKTGFFNQNPMDRRLWYAVVE